MKFHLCLLHEISARCNRVQCATNTKYLPGFEINFKPDLFCSSTVGGFEIEKPMCMFTLTFCL